jgi:hypothetical protein
MWDGMGRDMDLIWGKREAKYFCGKDWTGSISLIRFDKFVGTRKTVRPCGGFLLRHNRLYPLIPG